MKAYEARERDSPHVRAPATWRSIVTADIVDQPQPASCRSTSQVDDASQRLDSTIRGILPAFSLLFYGVGSSLLQGEAVFPLSLSPCTLFVFLFLFFTCEIHRARFEKLGVESEGRKEGRKLVEGPRVTRVPTAVG